MSQRVTAAALVIAAVIHLLPLTGVLGGARIEALYGVRADDPALALLLRHRAVLFGMLGAFLLLAAWRPQWRVAGLAAGLVSVVSFLVLARLEPGHGAALARVVRVDVVALAALLIGVAVMITAPRGTTQ